MMVVPKPSVHKFPKIYGLKNLMQVENIFQTYLNSLSVFQIYYIYLTLKVMFFKSKILSYKMIAFSTHIFNIHI